MSFAKQRALRVVFRVEIGDGDLMPLHQPGINVDACIVVAAAMTNGPHRHWVNGSDVACKARRKRLVEGLCC